MSPEHTGVTYIVISCYFCVFVIVLEAVGGHRY